MKRFHAGTWERLNEEFFMRRAYWSLIAIGMMITIIATACGSAAPAASAVAPGTPVATSAQASGMVTASVSVEPVQKSQMAFNIAAPVKEVDVKAGDQVKAGQTLIVLDTPELGYAVTSAQAELHSAQTNAMLESYTRQYHVWTGRKWIWVNGIPEVRAQADARVQQGQAAVDVAHANLVQGTLVAPYDGTVVSIDVDPGEMVVPQRPVLVIANLSHLQIRTTDLSEREIADVQIGQAATIKLKAFSQDLPGKVVAISPLSNLNNGDTVFKVTIELDNMPKGLMWGMTGDVSIQVNK
jgi:RND family efflux transporter MFP subunit